MLKIIALAAPVIALYGPAGRVCDCSCSQPITALEADHIPLSRCGQSDFVHGRAAQGVMPLRLLLPARSSVVVGISVADMIQANYMTASSGHGLLALDLMPLIFSRSRCLVLAVNLSQ